ncbi:hypothetical protein JG687_00014447 [Phytophthora cactorum]|uniref:DDE Tnp4 domain-containing protein n=1 Tax=Phytophthora cactorum TaxID=29920 RepID=A0A8T1U1K2_9STRA|nr:hypothetical protein JG687_00014447 [Phytophthora cactorum]
MATTVESVILHPMFKLCGVKAHPGSWSDRKCWNYSAIGRSIYSTIPPETHFIGDAGYALVRGLVVPCCEREEGGALSSQQKTVQLPTRMPVESTFGLWKGRFQILQGVMNQETPPSSAHFVVATVVLHNLMILYNDDVEISQFIEEDGTSVDFNGVMSTNLRQIGVVYRNAIASLICSYNEKQREMVN